MIKSKFNSMLEIPYEFNARSPSHSGHSGSESSAPNSPELPHRILELRSDLLDESQDVKSLSGSSTALRKALKRTFSWGNKKKHNQNKHTLPSQEKLRGTEPCKIYVLGYPGAGKTAAVVRFLTGRYIHEYQSSKEETYTRDVSLDGKHTTVQLTSIAEQIRVCDERLVDAHTGVLMLYSVVDLMSFYYVQHLIESIGPRLSCPVVLVGTKVDLGDKRRVKKSTALQLAKQNNFLYFEVSAALDIGVKECFDCLLRKVLVKKISKEMEQKRFKHSVGKRKDQPRRSSIC